MVPTWTETVFSEDVPVSTGPPALYKPCQEQLCCRVAKLILSNVVFLPGLIFNAWVLHLPEHYLLGGLRLPVLQVLGLFCF